LYVRSAPTGLVDKHDMLKIASIDIELHNLIPRR
jgi:hypothetical protein